MGLKLTERSFFAQNWHIFALIAILFGAAALYLSGVTFGLPYLLHADEHAIVNPAIELVKNHSLEPQKFNRPDHLLIQISSILYTLYSAATGVPIERIAATDIGQLHLISRVVTVCFALGCVFMAYRIGREKSRTTGIFAALLLAFCPLYTTVSFNATPDIPITFFSLLFMFFSMRYLKRPDFKNLLFMCLVTAAFICTKYTGAILLIYIAVTVIASAIRERDYLRILKHALLTIALVFLFIFMISPVLILDFDSVKEALIFESRTLHPGGDGLGWGGNLLFYVSTYFGGTGILLLLCTALGVYALIRKSELFAFMPILFGFIYWIVLSAVSLHWQRWGLPMYISPLLLAAFGLDYILRLIQNAPRRRKLYRAIFAACLGLISFSLILNSQMRVLYQVTPDTRVASKEYCEQNGITKDNSIYETYTPLSLTKKATIFNYFEEKDGKYILNDPEDKYEYIVLSTKFNGRFLRDKERYVAENAIYDTVKKDFELLHSFKGATGLPQSFFEPLNIVLCIQKINEIQSAGLAGAVIDIYRIK